MRLTDDVHDAHVKGFKGFFFLVRMHGDVHVAPEVVGQVVVDRFREVHVLELGEGLEGRGGDDVNAQNLRQTVVVEIERVLHTEKAALVGVHGPRVLDHVDVFGRPAGGDVADDALLQQRPEPGETDVETCLFWDMDFWWSVP